MRIFDVGFVSLSKYIVHVSPRAIMHARVREKPTVAPDVKAAFLPWPYIASNETRLPVLTCLLTQYGMVYSAVEREPVRIH